MCPGHALHGRMTETHSSITHERGVIRESRVQPPNSLGMCQNMRRRICRLCRGVHLDDLFVCPFGQEEDQGVVPMLAITSWELSVVFSRTQVQRVASGSCE